MKRIHFLLTAIFLGTAVQFSNAYAHKDEECEDKAAYYKAQWEDLKKKVDDIFLNVPEVFNAAAPVKRIGDGYIVLGLALFKPGYPWEQEQPTEPTEPTEPEERVAMIGEDTQIVRIDGAPPRISEETGFPIPPQEERITLQDIKVGDIVGVESDVDMRMNERFVAKKIILQIFSDFIPPPVPMPGEDAFPGSPPSVPSYSGGEEDGGSGYSEIVPLDK